MSTNGPDFLLLSQAGSNGLPTNCWWRLEKISMDFYGNKPEDRGFLAV